YARAGVPVSYVGHPLAEELQVTLEADQVRKTAGLPPGEPYVALLPGSREQEVRRLLPHMLDALTALARAGRPTAGHRPAASPALARKARAPGGRGREAGRAGRGNTTPPAGPPPR